MLSAADQVNQRMVDTLVVGGDLWSPSLIAAFRATPRHRFLDRVFLYQARRGQWREVLTREPGPEELALLYSDQALLTHLSPEWPGEAQLPISSSSQPSLMALMLEDLRLAAGQRVLEIGAGTGYNAALMAHVVGSGGVITIDVDRNVLSEAWDHLRAFPERDIQLKHSDGRAGFLALGPYDRIIVTAATPDLEPAWLEQLAAGGLLVAPLVLAPGLAYVVRGIVTDGVFRGRLIRPAYFMPLRAESETGRENETSPALSSDFISEPAPWSACFGRRRTRGGWLRFGQALAFHSWLRGFHIHYRTQASGPPLYAVGDGIRCCWLGPRQWQVRHDGDRELGQGLWRAFLEAGGPWPTEFQLHAAARPCIPTTGDGEEYQRQGVHCRQIWKLIETRDRSS
jgi:protein-L-isoaspartate(D-aspartate) O-methyltransferase